MINDIWGLKYDENMAGVIADSDVACVLMHNKDNKIYNSFVEDTLNELKETIAITKKVPIPYKWTTKKERSES